MASASACAPLSQCVARPVKDNVKRVCSDPRLMRIPDGTCVHGDHNGDFVEPHRVRVDARLAVRQRVQVIVCLELRPLRQDEVLVVDIVEDKVAVEPVREAFEVRCRCTLHRLDERGPPAKLGPQRFGQRTLSTA